MTITRMTSRKKLAELLLAGTTKASTVLAYQPSVIGATPAIYIRSISADRPPLTVRGKMTIFEFDILIVVLQANSDASPPWTEDKAEDLMDAIEAEVCAVMSANRVVKDVWNVVNYARASEVRHFLEEGIPYLLEQIPITVEAYRDA